MTIDTADLTKSYNEFAERTAQKQAISPEDAQIVTMALRRPENTPGSLSDAYQSLYLCTRNAHSATDAEKIIDMFCTALANPKNNKTSIDTAASYLSSVDLLQTQASIKKFGHSLHSYLSGNKNTSEALSNTYDFFYGISKNSANAYMYAHKQIASITRLEENDANSVAHAIDGLNKAISPHSQVSRTFSSGFLEVAESCLNNPKASIYQTSTVIMANLPKLGNIMKPRAVKLLNDTLEKADSTQTYFFSQAMKTSQLPEKYPELSLKFAQTLLNKKDVNDDTLGSMCEMISKAAQTPELAEQVSDIYKQTMQHPSCSPEILEEIYEGLSAIIKAQPSQAPKLLKTYEAAMQHSLNDSESLNTAQKQLSDISPSHPDTLRLMISQQKER